MPSIKSRKSDKDAAGREPEVLTNSNQKRENRTSNAGANTRDQQVNNPQGGGGGSKGGGGKLKPNNGSR